MAYVEADRTHPVITDTRTVGVNWMRYNLNAIMDCILMGGGVVPGYDYSVEAGTNNQPTEVHYTNGNDIIRLDITWGTVGGEDGNITRIDFYQADDGVPTWNEVKRLDITYDANGDVASYAWSAIS